MGKINYSRLYEYYERILKEDILHQFSASAVLQSLQVNITVDSSIMSATDMKYKCAAFLESITGQRPVVAPITLSREQLNDMIYANKGKMTEKAGERGRASDRIRKLSSLYKGQNLTAEDYRKAAGSSSGISMSTLLENDDMFYFIEKLREYYLPDLSSPGKAGKTNSLPKQPADISNPYLGAFSNRENGLRSFIENALVGELSSCHIQSIKTAQLAGKLTGDFLEEKRRSLLSRYYQVWNPSKKPMYYQARNNLQVVDNPAVAVTTLCLNLSDCLKFPDIETNFEPLSTILSSKHGEETDIYLYIRPTIAVTPWAPGPPEPVDKDQWIPKIPLDELHTLSVMDYLLSSLFNPGINRLFYIPKTPVPPNKYTRD